MSGDFLVCAIGLRASNKTPVQRDVKIFPSPGKGAEVAKQFLAQVVEQARCKSLTSDEHFTVDGTLLEAWAGVKSFQRKEGSHRRSDVPAIPR